MHSRLDDLKRHLEVLRKPVPSEQDVNDAHDDHSRQPLDDLSHLTLLVRNPQKRPGLRAESDRLVERLADDLLRSVRSGEEVRLVRRRETQEGEPETVGRLGETSRSAQCEGEKRREEGRDLRWIDH